jgi:DNA repair protein RadB
MKLPVACAPLDDLLGGGVESGAITLLYGEAGTGKTNFCLQLSREAHLQGRGKVVYVDSEGVSMERLAQISGDRAEAVAKNILFFSPQTLAEQVRMVSALDKIKDPGLIILDSLNMYYRLELPNVGGDEVGKSLTNILGHLLKLTRVHDVPIVVTGQVYSGDEGTKAFGGRIMEHIVKAILRLDRMGPGIRRATILKHRSLAEGRQAEFYLTSSGLSPSPSS